MSDGPEDFARRVSQAKTFIRVAAPKIVGVEAVKHFKHSFQKGVEGFTDDVLEQWPDISENRKKQKRKKSGAMTPILTGETGDLEGSITYNVQDDTVVVSTDVPYAQRHNEGLKGMPKRQFMGPSKALDKKTITKITTELNKIFS